MHIRYLIYSCYFHIFPEFSYFHGYLNADLPLSYADLPLNHVLIYRSKKMVTLSGRSTEMRIWCFHSDLPLNFIKTASNDFKSKYIIVAINYTVICYLYECLSAHFAVISNLSGWAVDQLSTKNNMSTAHLHYCPNQASYLPQ